MSNTTFFFFSFRAVREGEHSGSKTYRVACVLHKGVASGLAAQRTSLVKEVIETREFPEFGEDLDEGVSGARRDRLGIALLTRDAERD